MEKTKLLFCWSDISGYMTACWRALAENKNVDLHIIAFANSRETSFHEKLVEGLNIYRVNRNPKENEIVSIVRKTLPDVIVLCGWFVPSYKSLLGNKEFNTVKFILAMDTPWRGTIRQSMARLFLRPYVSEMDAVLTSGERSYQYAHRLGASHIYKFQYGIDTEFLEQALIQRKKSSWPRRFLFVGRYAHEKGIETLVSAYNEYRKRVEDPWELHACGQGSLGHLLQGEGITNHGFVQPAEMVSYFASAGCLVLPSHFDPWPLIIVEACAAGLPVIATHACGSQVEVVKAFYDGLVYDDKSPSELIESMRWIHDHYSQMQEMGECARLQALPYSAELWAAKFIHLIDSLNATKEN